MASSKKGKNVSLKEFFPLQTFFLQNIKNTAMLRINLSKCYQLCCTNNNDKKMKSAVTCIYQNNEQFRLRLLERIFNIKFFHYYNLTPSSLLRPSRGAFEFTFQLT